MDILQAKETFLKDDLHDALKGLFVGAVTWLRYPDGMDPNYERALGLFTCLVQARSLYEFFFKKQGSPKSGGNACAAHFAVPWSPRDKDQLYSRYMDNETPAQKRVFHLVYEREKFSGGKAGDESEHLKNRVVDFARDLRRLTDEFARSCNEAKHRELAECALARALRAAHELAERYKIPCSL